MYKKIKFSVFFFSLFFAAAVSSPSSANEWLDGLKSLKNGVIKKCAVSLKCYGYEAFM